MMIVAVANRVAVMADYSMAIRAERIASLWPKLSCGFEEFLHRGERRDPSPGTDVHAFHRCNGMGETDHIFQYPILKQAVNEGAVKHVARPGRIRHGYFECRRLDQLSMCQEY